MFNNKRHKYALDLSQPFNPESVPGSTGIEKIENIAQILAEKVGPLLDDPDMAYKLVSNSSYTDVKPELKFLEKYSTSINKLIKEVQNIKSRFYISGMSEIQIQQIIISKMLEIAQQKFIPELVEIMRTGKRSNLDVLGQLATYQQQEEIRTIREFISREIQREKREFVQRYQDIKEKSLAIPGFGIDQLQILVMYPEYNKGKKMLLSSDQFSADGNSKRQIEIIADEISQLDKEIKRLPLVSTWRKILALQNDLPEREKWISLVPDPISWNLQSFIGMSSGQTNQETAELKRSDSRDPAIAVELQKFFTPRTYLTGSQLPFMSHDDFDFLVANSEYFPPNTDFANIDLRKIRLSFPPGVQRDPQVLAKIEDIARKQVFLKDRFILQQLSDLVTDDYDGPNILQVVRDKNSEQYVQLSDEVGQKLQFFFETVCRGKKSEFAYYLQKIFKEEEADLVLGDTKKLPDTRYQSFGFTFLSGGEQKICNILREDYNLDAVPMPVEVPIPDDCPTNTYNFKVDFLISAPVYMGEDENGIPKIVPKVMFAAEYTDWQGGQKSTLPNKGKEWLDPDGNVVDFTPIDPDTGEVLQNWSNDVMVTGKQVYDLRTQWKKRTYEVIGHLIGTDTLMFTDKHVEFPWRIGQELDEKNIVYSSKYCSGDAIPDENSSEKRKWNANEGKFVSKSDKKLKERCYGLRMLQMRDRKLHELYASSDYRQNVYDNPIEMCVRLVDCNIAKVKIDEGIRQVKSEFTGMGGFDGPTMKAHMDYRDGLIVRKNEIDRILSGAVSISRDKRIQLDDEREEIKKELLDYRNSPLASFKTRLEEVISQGAIQQKIQALEQINTELRSGEFTPNLAQLRVRIADIDKGILPYIKFD